MTAKHDPVFVDGLIMHVRLYTHGRAEAGEPMTLGEIIGGLLSVIAMAIEQGPNGDYRRRLIKATHTALDDRLAQPHTPTSEAIN